MPTQEQAKLHDLLHEFHVGVLVTHTADGDLHARPMAIAHVEDDCTTWFVTSRSSPKVHELYHSSRAHVVCQNGSSAFLSLSGDAAVVDDRAKLDDLWTAQFEPWFPKGKEDPELTLVRVTPDEGEYWDGRGALGIKYLVEAVEAVAKGTRPKIEAPDQHGRTKL
jgi:general stress protein 26